MTTVVGTVIPVAEEFLGIGREGTTGTVAAPTATIPTEKIDPENKVTYLEDNTLRGMMATLFSITAGTESAAVDFSGPVYLDTIGHVLLNLMGDYSVTGTPGASNGTGTATSAGATTMTIVGGTASLPIGTAIQIPAGTGTPAQIVVLSALSTTTLLTFANTPLRFAVSGTPALTVATAPFTHTFSLLNSSPGQPPTHTITHYDGITGTNKAAQFAYWCATGCSFNMDAEKLFMHDTKGVAYTQQAAAAPVTNSFSTVPVYPNWRFAVGIAGPASGGTLVNNITLASLDINRVVKPYWTASGQQLPYVFGRNALSVEGKFTEVAQNNTNLTSMLNNTQQILQLAATNGLGGANLLAITFNMNLCAFETVKLNNNDVIEYESTFKAIANSTNAGASGGQSPISIIIQNAVPTY
ncbi:hypothetical protein EAS64_33885 [Trebonia kvetii]|uniref:Uncharacterized protein n=1 Tax=Trebonia kvetii TaxID=2480626 RepID=A0A6P2BQG1_9ACTN|nr:hypothetical protein [Trebonia kvetii]TVZ01272.1 hypothetical protein EAS64_33885 [Trebonia kvetii]